MTTDDTRPGDTRSLLRELPALAGVAPPLDLDAVPDHPVTLFLDWLDVAMRHAVPEPHAMTMSTVDATGLPDARVLVLKDVDARGWAFASTRTSAKGGQLAANTQAALTFWWQPIVRSVRVRGHVVEASRDESLADLAARSAAARADVDPDDWTLWRVVPSRVEFWQGSSDRRHLRIVFDRDGDDWRRQI
ncbi:pyridoxine/pyridoxamine 5'-phosphate oxidase [Gordonia desulfuricans]|uniref:pyridoxine/pyridoxamine 5'-phosphate oxidase n=1 Tax=Gordonia desulfuricans TaxID=89051 RepID=UPI000AB295EA|nr:pyridoxamine 5'-phosphate oxidase family protein [Gordonia desulfuricans]